MSSFPPRHPENLRSANLLSPSADPTALRALTVKDTVNRRGSDHKANIRRYYDGSFPSHDTKLRFLATDNPKKSGTAA
jgi:hypothetical protein